MTQNYQLYAKGKAAEVTPEVYKEYYKLLEHEKYLDKKIRKNEYSYEGMQEKGINFEFSHELRTESAEEQAMKNIQTEKLLKAVAKLGEHEQKLVAMHFYQNMSTREIGRLLGVSHSTVSKRIKKIVDLIKKEIYF